jgi:hypothetical protein
MVNSQNGWPASADRRAIGVGYFEVAGVEFPGGVKTGDVAVVLGNIAREIHERVERLHAGWCWGHNFRTVVGSRTVSNHGSGTAIDINAPDHGIGQRGTFTAKQTATIRAIMRAHDDVVRWGGDYAGRPDEMHFEINASAARVATLADKIRNAEKEDDMEARDVWGYTNRDPDANPLGKDAYFALMQTYRVAAENQRRIGALEKKIDGLTVAVQAFMKTLQS